MSLARKLRAVSKPTHTPVTAIRAAAIYPHSPALQQQWLRAVQWMQSRPQGSVWLLDSNHAPVKWRAIPEGEPA